MQVSGRTVVVRAFRYPLVGIDGYEATVLFLDTDLPEEGADERDAADLYGKLERTVLPGFYGPREPWLQRMRQAIALNASVFNSHRMVQQYVTLAYLP